MEKPANIRRASRVGRADGSAAFKLHVDRIGHQFQHRPRGGVDARADDAADKHIAGHRRAAAARHAVGHADLLRLAAVLGDQHVQLRLARHLEGTGGIPAGLPVAELDWPRRGSY